MTREIVTKVASLARLRFAESELDGFTAQFHQIVAYVEQLNEVNTDGVEPMASTLEAVNVLREDVPGPMLTQAEALGNAPRKTEGFFTVPKVIGDITE